MKYALIIAPLFLLILVLSAPALADTIQLKRGWNMVAGYAFSSAQTDCNFYKILYEYDTANQKWVLLNYPQDAGRIDERKGYFAWASSSCSITSTAQNREIEKVLYQGWNLVAGLSDARSEGCRLHDKIYNWNNARNDWDIISDINQMQPGKGYWVYSYNYCVLSGYPADDGTQYKELKVYLYPKLNIPNSDFKIYTKTLSVSINKQVYAFIYDSVGNRIKTIRLFNDGLHGDNEPNDYISGNFFQLQKEGQYSIALCVGNSENSCHEISRLYDTGEPATFEVKQMSCEPLYSTNNDKSADRINMVLIGSNYENMEQFKNVAKKVLSLDGNPKIKLEPFDARIFDWGLFSIEPFKSNKDKFNIWYLSTQLTGSLNTFYGKTTSWDGSYLKFCNIKYVYPAFIVNGDFDPNDIYKENPQRAYADFPDFLHGQNIDKNEARLGHSFNSFPISSKGDDTIREYRILAHETGHALFALSDEYTETGRHNVGYPNCASSKEEAERWWGDLVGQVDPFYYKYKETAEANGIVVPTEDNFRVQYVIGGCGLQDGEAGAVRPTKESIMRDTSPIFGSVNRRRAEQVLSLFSGG